MTSLQRTILAGAVIATVATLFLLQHHAETRLQEENQALRGQVDQLKTENQRLLARRVAPVPAPANQLTTAPTEPAPDSANSTNLIARLMERVQTDSLPKLSAAQIEAYLKENGRNAGSLLAAFRTTGESSYLDEALQKFPNDPRVNFAAIFKSGVSPDERRLRLDAFKQTAPQNALANYLSAREYFKSGQTERALEELNAAGGKPLFQDYSADFVQDQEEAWRVAGYSVAEAKTTASATLLLPHLGEMKQLSRDVVALANTYQQAGDQGSAQTALLSGLTLGERLDGAPGQALINELVGVAIQAMALQAMDPSAVLGDSGQTVQSRLDELTAQRAEIKKLASQFDSISKRMSDQDWISYKDRWRSFGEEAALRWVIGKYGTEAAK